MAWHLIKSGEDGSNSGYAYKEFLLDTESDINNEPTEFGPSYDLIIDGSVSCADDGAGNITITW